MNGKPRSSSCFVLAFSVPISFILGLIIGLVVLGWWLWPVEWSGGDISTLGAGAQLDYLNAAVSSYAYDQDTALAQSRFASLGEKRNAVLAALYAAEPDRSGEIERFAEIVGAGEALTAPEATPAEGSAAPPTEETAVEPAEEAAEQATPLFGLGGPSLRLIGVACLGLLFLVVLILLLMLSRRRRKGGSEPSPVVASEEETSVESITEFELPSAHPAVETKPETRDETLPDWLNLSETTDAYQTVRLNESEVAEPLVDTETVVAEAFDELPVSTDEELTDEDIAAITAQDFSASGPSLAGAAIFSDTQEAIHFPGSSEPVETEEVDAGVDFWTEIPQEQASGIGTDMAPDWLQTGKPMEAFEEQSAMLSRADETQDEIEAKFSDDVGSVYGIEPGDAEKLRTAGIGVPLLLLHHGATAEGRRQIAQEADVDEDKLLEWVKFVDLYRIKGVDRINAELLYKAGAEDVPTLAHSDPSQLYESILNYVEEDAILPADASLEIIKAWIEQAKKLQPVVLG